MGVVKNHNQVIGHKVRGLQKGVISGDSGPRYACCPPGDAPGRVMGGGGWGEEDTLRPQMGDNRQGCAWRVCGSRVLIRAVADFAPGALTKTGGFECCILFLNSMLACRIRATDVSPPTVTDQGIFNGGRDIKNITPTSLGPKMYITKSYIWPMGGVCVCGGGGGGGQVRP